MANNGNLSIENAKILFRNFSGKEGKFNAAGNRNFCLIIDDENTANVLKEDGWNVKVLQPKDPDAQPAYYIQVKVQFEYFPPKVYLITSKNKTKLDETNIDLLDYAEIDKIDLSIRPYKWEVNGNSGIKAYLKTMYVTIVEDEFESKYASLDELGQSPELEDMPF